jgi:hypothetical protein
LPHPLSLGQVVFHLPPLLTMFYYSLLFVVQFLGAVQFWMMLSGSGDEFCDLYLPCFGEWLITSPLSSLPFKFLFTNSSP